MINTYAKTNDSVSELEIKNAEISRRAATEGIVLLKNDGTLPLKPCKISVFGKSAPVTGNCRYTVSINEGLKKAGFEIINDTSQEVAICFYIISGALDDTDIKNITKCTFDYNKTVLIINTGCFIDLSPLDDININSIIFLCLQGAEEGHALADIVRGAISPSGRLASGWPRAGALETTKNNDYAEGIYVGYRYYDSFNENPRYEFGFGLGYSTFSITPQVTVTSTIVTVEASVKNTGDIKGKTVVQAYASCPSGKFDKEFQRLVGFAKTPVLEPQESTTLSIVFSISNLASYDMEKSLMLLEQGDYIIRVGESSRNTNPAAIIRMDNEAIASEHIPVCPLMHHFKELHSPLRENEALEIPITQLSHDIIAKNHTYQDFAACDHQETTRLLESLTNEEEIELCVGQDASLQKSHFFTVPGATGYSTINLENRGIPAVSFCKGSAGLQLTNIEQKKTLPMIAKNFILRSDIKNLQLYQYTTAFPKEMAIAQTWNQELATEIGAAIQEEMRSFGVVYWLAPSVNINRNPMCPQSYKYLSEDPLLSGKIAAAITRGVQTEKGFYVALKYFCITQHDNQPLNISERTLREIYLRGFEIAVKEGGPKAIITSNNKINGTPASESYDLCTKILRNEWGFDGVVMTTHSNDSKTRDPVMEIKAGVSLIMHGTNSDIKQIKAAVKNQSLSQATINRNASYVLRGIVDSNIYDLFGKLKENKGANLL